MLDRTDRSLVGVWWWTIDRWLLASALLLMVIGTPVSYTHLTLPTTEYV